MSIVYPTVHTNKTAQNSNLPTCSSEGEAVLPLPPILAGYLAIVGIPAS